MPIDTDISLFDLVQAEHSTTSGRAVVADLLNVPEKNVTWHERGGLSGSHSRCHYYRIDIDTREEVGDIDLSLILTRDLQQVFGSLSSPGPTNRDDRTARAAESAQSAGPRSGGHLEDDRGFTRRELDPPWGPDREGIRRQWTQWKPSDQRLPV